MKWYVVRDGEVIFSGTEDECGAVISEDMTDELEMYPADAYCEREKKIFKKT